MIPELLDQSGIIPIALWAFISGVFLSFIYDIFRIRRIIFSPEAGLVKQDEESSAGSKRLYILDVILIFVEDLFIFLLAAVIFVLIMYKLNGGRIRLLALVPLVCGFALYRITLGKKVISGATALISFVRSVCKRIADKTIKPFVAFLKKKREIRKEACIKKRRKSFTEKREKELLDAARNDNHT